MKNKSIMVQGTSSTVGKSIMCTALCRILTQDGYDVYPFKSQNMSLNSCITPQGHEISRAQVMQAEACKKMPEAKMNPLLLKPTSDKRSQVIFMGKVRDTLNATEYYARKDGLKESLQDVYDDIASEHEIIVLEGAGSPAEINLKQNDIVNMGMAKMAKSPVILVGDIDKGGVFASLYGTMQLLDEDERAMVKGIIINKFRGDITLLEPGLKQLEELTGVPVIGVVPYFDLKLEDEDSVVDFKKFSSNEASDLDIVVLQIPYMANFTDINSLTLEPGVNVRFVKPGAPIGKPDLLIIPGTKNTTHAAKELKEQGVYDQILQAHRGGSYIFGICGGYQILGKIIRDPDHVESDLDEVEGIGLLDLETVFEGEKVTCISHGIEVLFGEELRGYEIHMGRQNVSNASHRFIRLENSKLDGAITPDAHVIGTYFHGIFDNGSFVRRYLNRIRREKGIEPVEAPIVDYSAFRDEQYDALAQHVRSNLDMFKLYEIIDCGI